MNSPWEHIIRFCIGMIAAILVYQITQRSFIRFKKELKKCPLGYGPRFFGCLLGAYYPPSKQRIPSKDAGILRF
jgi:hypothetical protein